MHSTTGRRTLHAQNPRRRTWVTRNGQMLAVIDMTDVHVCNVILYLHRYARYAVPCLPALLEEAMRRGLLPLKEKR